MSERETIRAAVGEPPVPLIDLVAQFRTYESEAMQALARVFAEQKFILGDEVAEFEFEVAEYCRAREAIGCASGTDALILALMALDIGPGDEVITSPFTFFATGSSIYRLGARPVFVDIEPASYNIDPQAVAAAITPRTRAIMPVHLFGQCADMGSLREVAGKARIPIVEDACQAIGAEYRGVRAGALGTVGCFSFFPTKNLGGAGDAGMVTTNDATLAKRIRRLRVHGDVGQYEHVEVGLNSRLDAIQAAILRIKLNYLEGWTIARQGNAQRYLELFEEHRLLDAIGLPQALPECRHIYHQYCIRIPGQRDHVLSALRERHIGCAIYYPKPLHLQTCFSKLGYQPGSLPHAEQASQEVLALPVYSELSEGQQARVVRAIAEALGRAPNHASQPVVPRPKFLSAGSRAATAARDADD